MGLLKLVTVGQEQDGNFWTKNPIIFNRRTVRYYGIKQDPGRRTNLNHTRPHIQSQYGDIMGSNIGLGVQL